MTEQNISEITEAIKLAAKIREESWLGDEIAQYRYTEYESCFLACEKLNIPVSFARMMELTFHWWNDILDWADAPNVEADFTKLCAHPMDKIIEKLIPLDNIR